MTCRAAFAGLRHLLLGSAGQDTGASLTPPSAAPSGLAMDAYPLPRNVGAEQLPALKLALLTEGKRAKMLRQSKLAAQIEEDLRAVNHAILAKGR